MTQTIQGTPGARGTRRDRRTELTIALCAVPLAVLFVAGWQRRWMSDDGFIHLRVVDELLHGHGPVFNAGERVEASTSPLWVFQLALTRRILFFVKLEWIAIWWGLIGSVAGLAMAMRGAYLVARRRSPELKQGAVFVPFGALVVAAVAPFWDFTTSGLEAGMVFAWLGASFWALASRLRDPTDAHRRRRDDPIWEIAVLIGLGPLLRPDLALFTGAFLIALVIVESDRRPKRIVGIGVAAFAAPVAYEIFRMAFFATLVPNTALAKEPGMAAWGRGAAYLGDFLEPYWLWIPLVVIGVVAVSYVVADARTRSIGPLAVTAAPVLSALVYGLYVVRIGGDFMHARLLLPALYGVLLPFMVVAVSNLRTFARVVPVAIVAIWAVMCAAHLRVPYAVAGPRDLSNERGAWIFRTGHKNPVTIGDFAGSWAQYGNDARAAAARGERTLEVVATPGYYEHELTLPLSRDVHADGMVAFPAIGQVAYAAGTRVYVVDMLGLGDPIASRVRVKTFFLPGHNKSVDPSWAIARFVDADIKVDDPNVASEVSDARVAITCGELRTLLRDVTGTPTIGKLFDSFFDSFELTRLRFDRNPTIARGELCH